MVIVLAVIGTIIVALVADLIHDRHSTQQHQTKLASGVHQASKMFPHALTMVIMVAHASEITRVVSHVTWPHLAAALGVFVLWMLTSKGIEEL